MHEDLWSFTPGPQFRSGATSQLRRGKLKDDGTVQQLSAKRTTSAQFATLNQSVNATVIHAEQIGRLLNRVREPLRFGGERGLR